DFTGIALHARLDAHPNPGLRIRRGDCNAATQATGQRGWEVVVTLPVGAELAGASLLAGNPETIAFKELPGQWPDFGRRTLGQNPARLATFLQAELAATVDLQRLRARHLERATGFQRGNLPGHRQ